MREQFEKLPEIAELLIEAQFDEQTGEYVSYWSYKSGYLNGAWYAYQEQQKKIDKVRELLNQWDNWISVSANHNCIEIVKECADELRELLK